ncbi:MAG: LacI family DNA-binding transcriptional regulator [Rhodobacter sp.]|uniref:LacI family DNA-binding transcriptional regulator n=1 Tax=Pararhodobacter sp. TaxID=2127056 RepID=UPI001D1EAF2A|nr:LacI family DNA-binding transcriptional regulator [Pararhodobacter sp.]MCB1360889.1 LacI family DNA-binding transcriptional regulator [Paracoccaceae bacterium]MCC0072162.1 LacI family DNA-binding transcriptional regulator [Rhodobacter sp.]HPD93863.1 LacI family DNA-binding transcriptional regulator [Pararhodobacter sp.]
MAQPPRHPENRRPLTLRDVSEACGVSEMTVSRVLRNREDVSPATREKVLAAARALGYVPNKIAGGLASQQVNLVAVIVPSLSNMVFPEVLSGISAALEDTGLQPVFGVTNYSPDKEENVLYEMLSWRPSGVIVAGLEHTESARAMLENAGIPIVEIMDSDGSPIDSVVGISHRAAGRQMAEAIVAAGYRKIGFLGTKMADDHRARKRLEGLTEGLAEHGIALADTELYSGGSALKKGRELTEAILSRNPDLDFLYYSNDMIGAGGLLYCLEKGLDVPGKLGLAGFNGVDFLDGLPMRLATIDACRREIGEAAANIIAGKGFDDGVIGGHRIELSPRLEPGETIRRR